MSENIHIKLIKGLKQGSYEDFNILYSIYADMLYGFILNLTKSPIEAQDILQDTFMRIWQTHERINLELSFKTYLYTIARNLIIDSLRRQVDNVAFDEYTTKKLKNIKFSAYGGQILGLTGLEGNGQLDDRNSK